MKRLERVILVQFFLYDAEEIEIGGHCAFLGPNGTGKTAIADAIQIAMLGAHGSHVSLNAQIDTEKGAQKRTLGEYCLGALDGKFKRENGTTYVTLVFQDTTTGVEDSCGVSFSASRSQPGHTVNGLYVVRGVGLRLGDHVERSDDGEVPLRWSDFSHGIKAKALAAGTQPVLCGKPEQYTREMLVALGGVNRINPADFVKAFKKSILLRNIGSVDGFVRDFLIDRPGMDKQRAMAKVEHYKKLCAAVQSVKEAITELTDMEKKFNDAARAAADVVAYEVVAVSLKHDELQERHDTLKDHYKATKASLGRGEKRVETLDDEIGRLKDNRRDLEQAGGYSQGRSEMQAMSSVLESFDRERSTHRGSIDVVVARLEHAVTAAGDFYPAGTDRTSLAELAAAAAAARDAFKRDDLSVVRDGVITAYTAVLPVLAVAGTAVDEARKAHEEAEARHREAEATVRAAQRFGVVLEPDTRHAIDMLDEAGIKATPVCTVLKVADESWQAAIETFMSSNRESLLVPDGRENDAVTMLLNRQPRLYGAAIIQPYHLKEFIGRAAPSDQVASLFRSDDPVALAYARRIFGSMIKVRTVDELRRNSHSMTKEGGLSRTATTKALVLLGREKFKLGRRYDHAEVTEMVRGLEQSRSSAAAARQRHQALVTRRDRIAECQDGTSAQIALDAAIDRMRVVEEEAVRRKQAIAAIDTGEFAEIDAQIKAIDVKLKSAGVERDALMKDNGRLEKQVEQLTEALSTCEADLSTVSAKTLELRGNPDYDAQRAEDRREGLEKAKGVEVSVLIAEALQRSVNAAKRLRTISDEAIDDFRRYVDRREVGVLDERRDWRKARVFVTEEKTKLENSTLIEYQREADEARNVAEESFRKDVALSIANAIKDMRGVIRDMNRTLDSSPEFTRSERFRFTCEVRPLYKDVHDFLMRAAGEVGGDLFGDESEVSKKVMELLQESAEIGAGKISNPIDDFRMMFSFDVDITVRGELQARLSSRVGPGSGGEHKTPFYVIAGAALAHAYRLDAKSGDRGGAVMIIDEAFNKMDAQNSDSAARFLEQLGLQLIMTAPDDAFGKLVPFTDRIYDLTRSGMDVFHEVAHIKEPAKTLMRSDMVHEHPDLLTAEISRLAAAGNA